MNAFSIIEHEQLSVVEAQSSVDEFKRFAILALDHYRVEERQLKIDQRVDVNALLTCNHKYEVQKQTAMHLIYVVAGLRLQRSNFETLTE
jgi:hypothetical protein